MLLGRGTYVKRPNEEFNLTLPYQRHIPDGFVGNKKIRIVGIPHKHADKFAINLKNSSGSEIHFHFNPRFNEGHVVRNNFIRNDWQLEETHGDFPFQKKHPFTLDLIARSNDFLEVKVDGKEFVEFYARSNHSEATELEIEGDVDIHSITYRDPDEVEENPEEHLNTRIQHQQIHINI